MRFSRREILSTLFASVALPVFGQTAPKPRPNRVVAPPPSLARILAAYAPSGVQGVAVIDVASGRVLETHRSDALMPPASVAKAATALYAMRTLGAEYRFQTRVIGSGKIVNGVLQGDLTLVGGGDPALDTDGLASLVKQVKAHGIERVSGKFRVYHSALPYQKFTDKSQLAHVGYNPTLSGMNLNFNRVFFQWKRAANGYDLSLTAKTKSFAPEVKGIQIARSARELPVYQYRSVGGQDQWTVATKALGKGGSRWLPVRAPANYAAEVFRGLAADQGLRLPAFSTAKSVPNGVVLAQEKSAELWRSVRSMLKFSTNITAEIVGMRASQKRGGVKSVADSGKKMSAWLRKNYGMKRSKFIDHSGLSVKSSVSAEEMAGLFRRDASKGILRPLLKDIGLRNAEWKKAPLPGVRVVAKTGTLNFASCLGGYVELDNGRLLAFAILTDNKRARDAVPEAKRERADGASGWARQSRILQHQLLRRWALTYGG